MTVKVVDDARFHHAYKQLLYLAHSRYPNDRVSFTSGLWNADEGYKREFWKEANAVLDLNSWPEHRQDPRYIIQKELLILQGKIAKQLKERGYVPITVKGAEISACKQDSDSVK